MTRPSNGGARRRGGAPTFDGGRSLLRERLTSQASISSEALERATSFFSRVALAKGECFIRAGERSRQIGFVARGLCRYYYIDRDGNEFTKLFAREGEFLIDYCAYLTDEPCALFVRAEEPTTLLTANLDALMAALDHDIAWQRIVRKLVERSFIAMERRVCELLLLGAKERYLRFLEREGDLLERVPHHQIASFLGITPVSLSRIRRSMRLSVAG